MVSLSIAGELLVLEVEGLDRLWSLRSRLEIPLAHVTSVRPDSAAARHWLDGWKIAGTFIPGILQAGTFYDEGGLVFWDVHHAERAISIDLDHERYRQLVIEVSDPAAAVVLIQSHLAR